MNCFVCFERRVVKQLTPLKKDRKCFRNVQGNKNNSSNNNKKQLNFKF